MNYCKYSIIQHELLEKESSMLIFSSNFYLFSTKTYKSLNKTVGELLRTLIDHFNQISKTITDLFKSLYDGFNERILPSLKESYNHLEKVLSDLFAELFSAASHFFEGLIQSLKKFEGEFKKIGQTVSEATKKASKFISEQWAVIKREIEDIFKLAVDYVKALPGIDTIKEKYQEVSELEMDFSIEKL